MFVNQFSLFFFVWTAWFLDSVIVLEKSDVKTGHLTVKGGWAGWTLTKICVAKGEVVLFEEISSKPSASCSFFCLGPVVKNKCKGIISKAQWSNSCFLIVFRDSKVAPPIFVLVESSQGLHLCAVLTKITAQRQLRLSRVQSQNIFFWGLPSLISEKHARWLDTELKLRLTIALKKHMELRCSNELFSER